MFKTLYSESERKQKSEYLHSKYPTIRCIILSSSGELEQPVQCKFFAPRDAPFICVTNAFRQQLPRIKSEIALFYFVGGYLIPMSRSIEEIWKEHHDADGFLYISVAAESCFGGLSLSLSLSLLRPRPKIIPSNDPKSQPLLTSSPSPLPLPPMQPRDQYIPCPVVCK